MLDQLALMEKLHQFQRETGDAVLAFHELKDFLLREYLGNTWFEQNILSAENSQYLRSPSSIDLDGYKHLDRTTSLAEYIFNLQSVRGLERCLSHIRNSDVESGLAELEHARFFLQCGVRIEFRDAQGRKGEDYDTIVYLPGGQELACESESKQESTALSARTLRDTIEHARKQLPRDRPGLVFVTIPEAWVWPDGATEKIESQIQAVLRQSGRLNAVVVHWELWNCQGDSAFRSARYRFYGNQQARYPISDLEKIMTPLKHHRQWVDLMRVAGLRTVQDI